MKTNKRKINGNTLLLFITIALFIVMYATGCIIYSGKGFTHFQTFLNLFITNAGLICVACGMTVVMLTGGIDISVGSLIAMDCMLLAWGMGIKGMGCIPMIILVLVIGLVFGAVQGFLVGYLDIQPFIVTMAGLFFGRGMTAVICTDQISITQDMNKMFYSWANAKINLPAFLGYANKKGKIIRPFIRPTVIIALLVVLVIFIVLKYTKFGIIFVTHFLEQVYAVCDRITVMRNGQFVSDNSVAELPRVKLVAAMLGKDFDDLASIKSEGSGKTSSEVMLECKGLSHKGTIKPFDFTIHKGEVVGVTGLLGSGRSEMVRCIYGADRAQTGTEKFKGKDMKIKAPIDSIKAGMGYLPDDRKADGCIADLSVRENIILALQARQGMFKTLSIAKQNEIADKYIKELSIKTASRETPISQLSGGNQQKVILARWLATDPDFLILDEPTRGIDIGTKTEFQKKILELAANGMSVVFISSEIEEMLRTCSRMCVMRDGQKVGEITAEEGAMSQEQVMSTIAGGDKK